MGLDMQEQQQLSVQGLGIGRRNPSEAFFQYLGPKAKYISGALLS